MTESRMLLNQLLPNINSTIISLSVVTVCILLVYYFFAKTKKEDSKKHQKIIRKRFMYVMLVIDVLILAKIWVVGFTHIIAVMSLVAAGLVVTNKESIMNLVAGMIINWRTLFVEGDFVQIQTFTGYVSAIGFMYFTIYETMSVEQTQATGRTIKVPNNLIITAPLINFSPRSNLCLYKILLNEKANTPLTEQLKFAEETIANILNDTYAENPCYRLAYLKSHNRELASLMDLHPAVYLVPPTDKTNDLKISVQFYCFSRDYYHIAQQFWLKITA
ncbi:MAG: mechanosensitive ion channel domain-containing protein [Pseudomonadota bacterium]